MFVVKVFFMLVSSKGMVKKTLTTKQQHESWLHFLLFTQEEAGDLDLLLWYFKESFSAHQREFYRFGAFLEESINQSQTKKEKQHIAQRYLHLLSPLYDKFSFYEVKERLDDLCFQVSNPRGYHKTQKDLSKYHSKAEKITEKLVKKLKSLEI